MAISKLNPSAGGIPFGNTAGRPTAATGKLYSNGETARLELYTSTGEWANIVQEVPGVSGISGAYNESTGSATITITGTNFVSGAIASATGTNAVEVQATTTTYNSLVQLTAVFTGLNAEYEPFDIKITNPSNLFGLLPDALYINQSPVWQHSSGSLGTFSEGVSITPISALATDPENSSLTFSITSGALPSGLSLNTSTGIISGTPTGISSNTTYSFTISVTDGSNTLSRNFSILINSILSWNTSAGNIGTVYPDVTSVFSYNLSANALANTISYSVLSGSLPSGLSLNESTGVISGTANAVGSNTTSTFTIRASDGTATADRQFNIIVNSPIVSGGTVYSDSTYAYRTFTGSGTFTCNQTVTADILMVGGGGGGGRHSGAGGGAGGLVYKTNQSISAGSYSISIGSGGVGHIGAPYGTAGAGAVGGPGLNGQNTTAFGFTAIGGGGGGESGVGTNGASGGSGGGGSRYLSAGTGTQPSSATGGFGNNGGSTSSNANDPRYPGHGGGGAGATGGVGSSSGNGGNGGAGRQYSDFSTATSTGDQGYYAGGGAGNIQEGGVGGTGGIGGGGDGGGPFGNDSGAGENGMANTGGGGGGSRYDCTFNNANRQATGGSGIVIVRYTKASVGA